MFRLTKRRRGPLPTPVIHVHKAELDAGDGLDARKAAELIKVAKTGSYRAADGCALVLAAAGIDSHLVPEPDGVAVLVAAGQARRARAELADHARESSSERPRMLDHAPSAAKGFGSALAYALILMIVFVLDHGGAWSLSWTAAGSAQAHLILEGQWWRAVTALGLHADAGHLFGNILLGSICALLLAEVLGAGVGWLAIVLAGALGNGLNAAFQGPGHASVGASTAVFGALGVLSGHTQRAWRDPRRPGLRRWAPVAAGVMLLAFLGFGGGRTDVWAHVAGFAVGAVLGLAFARVPARWLQSEGMQQACGMLALVLFVFAWFLALRAAGL